MPKKDQGASKSRYSVIPRVLIFFFNEEEHEVLLIKGAENKQLWAGLHNGIGGHIKKGEDVQSAAKRELFEETGIEKSMLWLCGTVHVDIEDPIGILLFIFKGSHRGGTLNASAEGEPAWINLSKIQDYATVPDIPILLDRCADWHPGDPLFHLHSYYENGELKVDEPQAFNS
jgi:8-oxo-dGTP diphosphatase